MSQVYLDFETVQVDDKDNPEIKTLLAYQYSLVFVDKFNNLLFEKRGFSKEGKAGEMLKKKIPLRRFADINELDLLISLLLNRKNSYMTGSIITIDGGLSAGL